MSALKAKIAASGQEFYVRWLEPRHFVVRLSTPRVGPRFSYDSRTVGVVALSVGAAIDAVQLQNPEACIQSVVDHGPIHLVVDAPPDHELPTIGD